MSIYLHIMIALFMLTSLLLIGIILIQKGRGGGLSSAFGGGGGGHTAFGSKTGDVLTWATSIIFGIFLLLALLLNWAANPKPSSSTNSGVPIPAEGGVSIPVEAAPVAPATPAVPATPAAPAAPVAPVTPAAPATPAVPATPAAPATPAVPATPAQ